MTTRTMTRCLFAFFLFCSSLKTTNAWAQGDPKAAAHDHYEKGLAAFDEERFQDAADEFEAAYRISPAFAVLYNIGRVNVALGRSVEAVQAFEKYIAQGAAAIAPERRKEVSTEIDRQRARIGSLTIRTVPPSADVRIDGKLLGKTPLAEAVLVTAGKHTIEALLAGYAPQVREVDVGGRAQIVMDLRLDPVAEPESAARPDKAPGTSPTSTPTAPTEAHSGPAPTVTVVRVSDGEVSSNPMRTWGYVVAVVGLVGGATGGVVAATGVGAANDARNRAANATAPADSAQYAQASSDFDAAKSQTQLGWTIAGIGGGVLLAGALLVVISPDHKATTGLRTIAPWVGANSGGVGISGVW
jgi:tetratricopeptide (TPR) repeat protein